MTTLDIIYSCFLHNSHFQDDTKHFSAPEAHTYQFYLDIQVFTKYLLSVPARETVPGLEAWCWGTQIWDLRPGAHGLVPYQVIKPQMATSRQTVVSAIRWSRGRYKRIRWGRGPEHHHQAAELRLRSEGYQRERRISQAEGEVRAPPGRGDSGWKSWEVPDKLSLSEGEGERAWEVTHNNSSCNTQTAIKTCSGLLFNTDD